MRILNFGSLNLDYVYQMDHFVQPGETIASLSQEVNAGGKGLNQSVALSRAGARVCHAGCTGKGGESLRSLLEAEGVDLSFLKEVPEIQGNAVIQVNREGENCIILFGGSNRAVTPEQVEETFRGFEAGDYVLLQNEISCLKEIVQTAAEKGMTIVLNPSPFEESLKELPLEAVGWLIANEVEAEQFTGETEPEEVWKKLHASWPGMRLVLTLGGSGAWCFTPEEAFFQEAFPVKAVDTTAAGDTFTGYFLAALTEGRPLPDCMRYAAKAASIAVTRPGAAPSIPAREEVFE